MLSAQVSSWGLSPFTMCSVPFASLDACFLISCPLPYFLAYALVWVEHILQYFYEKWCQRGYVFKGLAGLKCIFCILLDGSLTGYCILEIISWCWKLSLWTSSFHASGVCEESRNCMWDVLFTCPPSLLPSCPFLPSIFFFKFLKVCIFSLCLGLWYFTVMLLGVSMSYWLSTRRAFNLKTHFLSRETCYMFCWIFPFLCFLCFLFLKHLDLNIGFSGLIPDFL